MMGTPLNILLITVDQWRGDMLGSLGHPFARTPALDALAREGTHFTRHYTQAYPCGPARAGLFTGLYPHKHRAVGNGIPLDPRHPTLFTELRRGGYRPTLFGYTDITPDPRSRAAQDPDAGDYEGVCPGLAVETLLTERATPWLADLKAKGYAIPDPDAGRHGIFEERGLGEPAVFTAEDSETAFLTNRLIDWIAVSGQKPFCAHISYIAPHPPFAAAAPYHRLIDPADVSLPMRGATPEVEAAQHPLVAELLKTIATGRFIPRSSGLAAAQDEATIRRVRATYAGLAAEVDHHLGRLFQSLRDSGRWDKTLIIVTADHGEQMFDHWMLGKTGFYDQSAHIPLIVRDPRVSAAGGRGQRVTAFTEAIDLMPTILEATGLTMPRNGDGRSLLPFCAGETPADWRDAVHWSFDFRDIVTRRMETALGLPSVWCNLQVVRTDRLKYVHFAGLPPVLFDLADDPAELINRAADPARQSLRMEGLDRLLTWRQRHEDETLTGTLARAGAFHRDL